MKPGEHPDFFRLPPPPGRSRESSIRLDASGRFWHDNQPVEHPGMARAFASWIRRHPDDGRFILSNDYDWSYFEVEDVPFFVTAVLRDSAGSWLELSDGSREPLDPRQLWTDERERVCAWVKSGQFAAKFARHAQLGLADLLVPGPAGEPALEIGGQRIPLPRRASAE
jgi:hypothetical protein